MQGNNEIVERVLQSRDSNVNLTNQNIVESPSLLPTGDSIQENDIMVPEYVLVKNGMACCKKIYGK